MSIVERERVETEVAPVTTKDVLHRAADLLEEFGWQQGGYGSYEEGSFCVVGAVLEAARSLGRNPWAEEARLYDGPIRDLLPTSVVSWNDANNRTSSEAVTFLRSAAELA